MKSKILAFIALSLLATAQAETVKSGTLSIFVTPAQEDLDFKTPQTMFKTFGISYLRNFLGYKVANLRKSGMGHVVARIDCIDTQMTEQSFFTGISGQYSSTQDYKDIFEDKLGIGVLFRGYSDGYVQSSQYVKYLIGDHTGRLQQDGRGWIRRMAPKFMSFEITPEQCDQVVDFHQTFKEKNFGEPPTYEEYVTMKENEPLYFNFVMDPFKIYQEIKAKNLNIEDTKMGGVCSSFAAGLLKVAGIFDPAFESLWKINFNVGESLIGNVETGHQVGLLDIAFRSQWIENGEPARQMGFYHPEYIWSFFEGVEDCLAGQTRSRFCTPQIKEWTQKHKNKLKASNQRIKYQKELRTPKGTVMTVDRIRELEGLTLSL